MRAHPTPPNPSRLRWLWLFQCIFSFNRQDEELITSALRAGKVTKKMNTYEFKAGECVPEAHIKVLKSDDSCGAFFQIFSDNIRAHVRDADSVEAGLLQEFLPFVQRHQDLGCPTTEKSVKDQLPLLPMIQDPPDVNMYYAAVGKDGQPVRDSNGFLRYCTYRGSNRLESAWGAAKLYAALPGNTPEFGTASAAEGLRRYNACRRRDAGLERDFGHFDYWLCVKADDASAGVLANKPYAFEPPPALKDGDLMPIRHDITSFSRVQKRKMQRSATAAAKRKAATVTNGAAATAPDKRLASSAAGGLGPVPVALPVQSSTPAPIFQPSYVSAVAALAAEQPRQPADSPYKCNCGAYTAGGGRGRRHHKGASKYSQKFKPLACASAANCDIVRWMQQDPTLPKVPPRGYIPAWVGVTSDKPKDWPE